MFRGDDPFCVASSALEVLMPAPFFHMWFAPPLGLFSKPMWSWTVLRREKVASYSLPSVLLWAVKLSLMAYSGKHSR